MMEEVRYHPLIFDGESLELVPMFSTTDAAAMMHNKFYIEETIPKYYRFCSKDELSETKASEYRIHCPNCGDVMQQIASPRDSHKHALCRCTVC